MGWYFDSGTTLVVSAAIGVLIPLFTSRDGEILGAILLIGLFTIPTFPLFDTIPWYMYAEIGIFVFGLIAFLIKKIFLKEINFNVGSLGIGLIALGVILLIATIVRQFTSFNEPSTNDNWGYITFGLLCLIIFAYFVFHMTSSSCNTDFIAKTFYIVSLIVLSQCLYALIRSKMEGSSVVLYKYTKWGSENTVALVLEICLPFLALIFSKNKWRIDTLIMIVLSYCFVFGADSRGGIVTCVLLLPFLIFILFRDLKNRRYVVTAVIVGLFVALSISYICVPTIRFGLNDLFNSGLNLAHRDEIWKDSYSYAQNNLLLGGGIQALFDLFPHYAPNYNGTVGIWLCHNTFFTIVAAGGWLAVICYVYHLVELFVTTYKAKFYVREALVYFILVGLIHGLVDNTFFNIIYMIPYFWIYSYKDFKGIPYTEKLR